MIPWGKVIGFINYSEKDLMKASLKEQKLYKFHNKHPIMELTYE